MHIKENKPDSSREALADALRIWYSAAISLVDIRHNLISPQEAVRGYRLPASTFIYTSGGKAEVSLDDNTYRSERFGLFHGGKGTELSILPHCEWLEYYMVLYKAGEPPFHKREFNQLLARANPFRQQYGFAPDNPLLFAEQLRKMYERWKGPTPLNLFYGKTSFYQLVYEVYEALEKGNIHVFEPDVIAMAKRYLDNHYGEQISIHDLRETLGISSTHFHRLFTAKVGQSAQEYLISKRLLSAKRYLAETDCTLREIAVMCGFADEFSLMRMFQRRFRMSTTEFRKIHTYSAGTRAIGNLIPFPYNEEDRVSLDKLKGEGAYSMFKQMSSKAVIAAALSLMLTLSACGTAPAANNGESSAPPAAVTDQISGTEATEPVEEGTRTVSTVMGDIEVPKNPQRVVVNWYIGDALAAGLNVVGYTYWAQETMPFYDEMMAITKIANWEPEDVMSLEPDLIITYKADDFEKFGKIAPVLVIEEGVVSPDRAKVIGDATGHSETANKNIETFEAQLAAAKEIFKSEAFEGKTFSIMEDWGPSGDWSGVAYETGSRGGTLVYEYLGLKYPDQLAQLIESSGQGRATLSYEVAHEYFGDYILWFRQVGKDSEYAKTDIWQSIPAVAEGRVLEIPGEFQGLFYYDDVLSLTAQLDYLVDALNTLVQ